MPEETKERLAVWLYPSTIQSMDGIFPKDGCKSRSEFVEKAVKFYIGFLSSETGTEFLSTAIFSVLKGIVQDSEHQLRNNLFKLATEVAMHTRILATYEGIDEINLARMRGKAVHDLKRTNGTLYLEAALKDKTWMHEVENGDA